MSEQVKRYSGGAHLDKAIKETKNVIEVASKGDEQIKDLKFRLAFAVSFITDILKEIPKYARLDYETKKNWKPIPYHYFRY